MSSDNYITLGLLVCVVTSYVMCARTMPLVRYQISNLFSTPNEKSAMFHEVTKSMPYVTCLILIGCITAAYFTLSCMIENGLIATSKENGIDRYTAIALFFLPFLITFLAKKLFLQVFAVTLLSHDKYKLANMEVMFFMAVQAMIVTSLALAHGFYGFNTTNAIYIAICSISLTEILTFYKEYRIFSKENGFNSHFFLYLCTLEAVSIALLIGFTAFLTNTLEINI